MGDRLILAFPIEMASHPYSSAALWSLTYLLTYPPPDTSENTPH